MTSIGGRDFAGLLSALAEAPDSSGAAAFLVTRIAELSGTPRACLLRIDAAQETLTVAATWGLDDSLRGHTIALSDIGDPLVISALSLTSVSGTGSAGSPLLAALGPWLALPMSQPRYRGGAAVMSQQQAAELATRLGATLMPRGEQRFGIAPAGVVVIAAVKEDALIHDLMGLVMLASPVVARLASMEDAWTTTERLTKDSERLRLMVDSLPDPVIITNAANDIIAHNQRAERLLYIRDGDSVGRRRAIEMNNLFFTSFLSKAMMTGGSQAGPRELNLVDPDEGNDLLFEVLAHPLGERVGPEDAVLSVLRDVTDLRRAANELQQQIQRVRQAEQQATAERDRLNLILENVADPILVTDERSNIILMNDQAEQLFQVSGNGTRTRREIQVIRGNDTKFTSFISEFALLDVDARRERMALVHPRMSQELPVEVVSGKVKNERGEPIAIVSVLHDLTKQVENEGLFEALKQLNSQLEERIREATSDLAGQNARLQWQSQEVERANRLKSEFLASMSHELRTPINALIGYTALMLEGILGEISPQQRDALERERAAAEHLLALINDILDLAKIEAGKMPLHVGTVDLREVADEVAEQIEPMVRKKKLDFVTDVASDVPRLLTDRTKVKQVLLNLLSNAAKFTARGRVEMRVRAENSGVRIDVIDSGIGIRPEDIDAVWEDFRQVDQSHTREYSGTGLGLSITRKLLDRLGGSVSLRSVYGEGSVFSVMLPLYIPAEHATPAEVGEELIGPHPARRARDGAVTGRPDASA